MSLDAKTLLANLAEQERIKGHHSPEGRAIRTLGRALSGWSTGNLSTYDVIVLCHQAVEDWLKIRLKRSPWYAGSLALLIRSAVENGLVTAAEGEGLKTLHELRESADEPKAIAQAEAEAALEFCVRLVEKHW